MRPRDRLNSTLAGDDCFSDTDTDGTSNSTDSENEVDEILYNKGDAVEALQRLLDSKRKSEMQEAFNMWRRFSRSHRTATKIQTWWRARSDETFPDTIHAKLVTLLKVYKARYASVRSRRVLASTMEVLATLLVHDVERFMRTTHGIQIAHEWTCDADEEEFMKRVAFVRKLLRADDSLLVSDVLYVVSDIVGADRTWVFQQAPMIHDCMLRRQEYYRRHAEAE